LSIHFCSSPLNQAVGILAGLHWWADVTIWAIMFVARSLVDITTGVGAFWATTSSRAEDHKGALLGASRAISITSTPRAESAEAHLRACISVALPSDLLELSILTVLATVLGRDIVDEPSRLDTSTTIITAL